MADHVISLGARKELALLDLLNARNTNPVTGAIEGKMTADELLREFALVPILELIRSQRAVEAEAIKVAYEKATAAVQQQVETLLGITISTNGG